MKHALPLNGIRVLDLTQVIAGPYASLLLADMGAEIIKIERPPHGDPARQIPPLVNGESAYFMSVNRNKRSLFLDLTQAEGKQVFYELVRGADVVLDNFRPGVTDNLGITHEVLTAVNPRIITCSISSFGQDGPYRHRPAFDLVVQAMSGLMSVTGEPGRPSVRMGLPMGDLGGGIFAAMGILAALFQRTQTGQGQNVDVALLDGLIGMHTYLASTYFATGQEPTPVGSGHHNIVPYQAFDTADSPLVIATFTDAFWVKLCRALELTHLHDDLRFRTNALRVKNRETLIPILEEVFRQRPRAEWLARLEAAGVPSGPVNSLGEALNDPQVCHRQMTMTVSHPTAGEVHLAASPLKFHGEPTPAQPPPLPGQQTDEILAEIGGCTPAQIADLRAKGVVV